VGGGGGKRCGGGGVGGGGEPREAAAGHTRMWVWWRRVWWRQVWWRRWPPRLHSYHCSEFHQPCCADKDISSRCLPVCTAQPTAATARQVQLASQASLHTTGQARMHSASNSTAPSNSSIRSTNQAPRHPPLALHTAGQACEHSVLIHMKALPSYTPNTHVLVPCPAPVTGKGAVSRNAAKVMGEPSAHCMDLRGGEGAQAVAA
jgi:hypothetical protein